MHKKYGLSFYTLDEFKKNMCFEYDLIIFSHVIEPFQPDALKDFLDEYLSYLKKGGYVIIATPVLWRGFYWDFDHIKMYHPIGINMVFGNHDAQVQYYAENRLELKDIWFRKTEFMVREKRGLYIPCSTSKVWVIVNLFYKALFKFSGGLIGRTTGWMGLYRKY